MIRYSASYWLRATIPTAFAAVLLAGALTYGSSTHFVSNPYNFVVPVPGSVDTSLTAAVIPVPGSVDTSLTAAVIPVPGSVDTSLTAVVIPVPGSVDTSLIS